MSNPYGNKNINNNKNMNNNKNNNRNIGSGFTPAGAIALNLTLTGARSGFPFPVLWVNVCSTTRTEEAPIKGEEDDPGGALVYIVFVMLFYSIGIFLFMGELKLVKC